MDLSQNVLPLLKLFSFLTYNRYLFIQLLGLEGSFMNRVAAVELYRWQERIRYVAISARKPVQSNLEPSEGDEPRRRRGRWV